jgi:hypothetical protein
LKLWNWDAGHIQDNFLPITDITMNLQQEFHDNSTVILRAALSNMWKATNDESFKKELEKL